MGISMNYTVTRPRQLEIAGFCFMMKLRVVYFHFPPFPEPDAAVVQFFFCCLSSYASLIFCNGSILKTRNLLLKLSLCYSLWMLELAQKLWMSQEFISQ